MDPVLIVNLVTVLLEVVLKIIQAKQDGQMPDVGTSVAEFLGQLGKVGKIKELQGADVAQVVPLVNGLAQKIHDLVESRKAAATPVQ